MTRSKRDLPQKICLVCGRPFSWRKKWERTWDQVRRCSEACRRNRGRQPADESAPPDESSAGPG